MDLWQIIFGLVGGVPEFLPMSSTGPLFLSAQAFRYGMSFLIGLCQSIAMILGASSSAATVVGGLVLRLKRRTIVESSFLLALPMMLATAMFDLFRKHFST